MFPGPELQHDSDGSPRSGTELLVLPGPYRGSMRFNHRAIYGIEVERETIAAKRDAGG